MLKVAFFSQYGALSCTFSNGGLWILLLELGLPARGHEVDILNMSTHIHVYAYLVSIYTQLLKYNKCLVNRHVCACACVYVRGTKREMIKLSEPQEM